MKRTYNRQPQDDEERQLLLDGWVFAGASLFEHPSIRNKYFTKENALNENISGQCPACGARYNKSPTEPLEEHWAVQYDYTMEGTTLGAHPLGYKNHD